MSGPQVGRTDLPSDGIDPESCVREIDARLRAGADASVETGRSLRLVASDTGHTWLVTLRGDRPAPGPGAYSVVSEDHADGSVRPVGILSAAAEDLLRLLDGEPPVAGVHRTGDAMAIAEFEGLAGRH